MLERGGTLRTAVAALAALLASRSVAVAEPPAPEAPSYAGRDADWWVGELGAPTTREAATLVLRRMGAGAHPAVGRALETADVEVRRAALVLLSSTAPDATLLRAFVGCLRHPDAALRHDAVMAIGRLGPQAVAAAPEVLSLLRDPDLVVRRQAGATLRALGPLSPEAREVALEVAVRTLADPDVAARTWAVETLRAAGPDAARALPALLARLDAESGTLRSGIVLALGTAADPTPEVVAALRRESTSSDPNVVHAAVASLGALAGTSPDALRALVDCLRSTTDPVRVATVQQLQAANERARGLVVPFVPDLVRALPSIPTPSKHALTALLASTGEAAKPAVLPMLEATAAASEEHRGRILETFRLLHPTAVGELVTALGDARPEIRSTARRALAEAAPESLADSSDAILASCGARLEEGDVDPRERRACFLLGARLGGTDSKASAAFTLAATRWVVDARVPRGDKTAAVFEALRDAKDRSLAPGLALRLAERWMEAPEATSGERVACFSLLSSMVGKGPVEPLVARFFALDPGFAGHAVNALAGTEPGRVLLTDLLAAGPATTRLAIVRSIRGLPDDSPLRPVLFRRLRDLDPSVRLEAARVLARSPSGRGPLLVPDHEDLLRVVVEALEGDEPAHWALAWIQRAGADARPALPTLVRRLASLDPREPDFLATASVVSAVDPGAWRELAPRIEEGLRSEDAHLRAGAFHAALKSGSRSPEVLALARPLLAHEDPVVRIAALGGVVELGPDAAPFAVDLATRLHQDSPSHAALAAHALGALAPESEIAREALTVFLADRYREDRGSAIEPLSKFGARAVPAIVAAMPDPRVRAACLQALRALGPQAREALPALEAAAQDPDPAFATMAREALGAVRGPP